MNGISAADYLSFADRHDVFAKTVPYFRDMITLTGAGDPDQFFALRTSGALFPLLGVPARLGRALVESDDQPGAPNLAVLSDRLWQRRFHSDPAVIGRSITVSGDLYTVAGVMPPRVRFSRAGNRDVAVGPSQPGHRRSGADGGTIGAGRYPCAG